jgi:NADH-quinone oxidoreductase subunit M
MLSGFVGEFLILSGAMQSSFAHHILWTTLATTGVILGAAYMLWMIQRLFYGNIGHKIENTAALDLTPREHLALWPLALLFLIMGIVSPYWMRAIDAAGTAIADRSQHFEPSHIKHVEAETYAPVTVQQQSDYERLRSQCGKPGVTCYDINGKGTKPLQGGQR